MLLLRKTPLLLSFFLLLPSTTAYPAYDNPIVATPPLVRGPGKLLCTIDLIRNAACDGYGKVTSQPFPNPASVPGCKGYVSKAIVDFDGSVKGVQYDRAGGLFLGGVELLRTTTPEPSPMGIAWHIEKDVSDYLSYILDGSQEKNATVGITNIVDSIYTGVIYVNATLSFYGRPFPAAAASSSSPSSPGKEVLTLLRGGNSIDKAAQQQPEPKLTLTGLLPDPYATLPLILPLVYPYYNDKGEWTPPPVLSGDDCAIAPLPTWPQTNIARVYLDMVASPHGCEEFFYTNLPSDEAVNYNATCGGGVYRELQVWVDGQLAGVLYPFVVLYTGGVNPFLWRPLSGIESFDIPAYRFDLTPFAGVFNQVGAEKEGAERPQISLKAFGNNIEGVWPVSSAMLLFPDQEVGTDVVLGGGIVSADDTGAVVTVEKSKSKGKVGGGSGGRDADAATAGTTGTAGADASAVREGGNDDDDTTQVTFKTVGTHAYTISGNLIYPGGNNNKGLPRSITTTVSAHLSGWNENTLLSADSQRTRGAMADHTTVERHESNSGKFLSQRRKRNHYPYFIQSYYGTDNSSMELRAVIDIAMERSFDDDNREKKHDSKQPFSASWVNQIKSTAVYNRSLDHNHTSRMVGESVETYQIFTSLGGGETRGGQRDGSPVGVGGDVLGAAGAGAGGPPCYDRHLAASAGKIHNNQSSYTCVFPPGLSFCGYQLCDTVVAEIINEEQEQVAEAAAAVAQAGVGIGKGGMEGAGDGGGVPAAMMMAVATSTTEGGKHGKFGQEEESGGSDAGGDHPQLSLHVKTALEENGGKPYLTLMDLQNSIRSGKKGDMIVMLDKKKKSA